MRLRLEEPLAGILQPVFSMRTENDLGVGDTEGVRQMIDWLHRHGLNVLQMLPINELSEDNSPYNAISSQAIEPRTLAVTPERIRDLAAEDFERIATPERLAGLRQGPVDYVGTLSLKRELLRAAFEVFLQRHLNRDTARAQEFRTFEMANAEWLLDYALFRALMEENQGQPAWDRWASEHRDPASARSWLLGLPEVQREELIRKQLFFSYIQWIAFSQWEQVKAYGTSRQVYLMGDIPFGVGKYSADVWANRAIFDLGWSGGAPPEKAFKEDPFTVKWGQNWGVPIYNWEELRRNNFKWWRTRVGNVRHVFHLYRIDHVLGLFRIYSFPWFPERNQEFLDLTEAEALERTGGRLPGFKPFADDTPGHRAINQAQGSELLRMIQESSGNSIVIAEDLGMVPEYVAPTLEELGIPGFRIPMFLREADGSYSETETYPRLSVAQPATHDHSPLAGSWELAWREIEKGNTEAERELRHLMAFAGLNGREIPREFTKELHDAFTRRVMNSPSWLVIFQYADVFGLQSRINLPGSVAASNWTFRMAETVRELEEIPERLERVRAYAALARAAGRGRAHDGDFV